VLLNLVWGRMRHNPVVLSILIGVIGISTCLWIGTQKIADGAKHRFTHSVSGVDLIVGPRSSDIQLLLHTVFRYGQATATLSANSLHTIEQWPEVAWLVPIVLGDSYRGHPVMGTTPAYFVRYQYGNQQALTWQSGGPIQAPMDIVVGSDVANTQGLRLGDTVHVSHGMPAQSTAHHQDHDFHVVGILNPTGTPVDDTVYTSVAAMDTVHGGTLTRTAAFVGLHKKGHVFRVQRRIAQGGNEPLMGIVPGIVLHKVWQLFRPMNQAVSLITYLIGGLALIPLVVVIGLSVQTRRQEVAVLRALGARPRHIAGLLIIEAGCVSAVGVCMGLVGWTLMARGFGSLIDAAFGVPIAVSGLSVFDCLFASLWVVVAMGVSVFPAIQLYRHAAQSGVKSVQ
jgi:putative ABC transport system permease protein